MSEKKPDPRQDRDFCILGAYALTIDDDLGEIDGAHIHVQDGVITVIDRATRCDLPGERVDGRGRIVLPGFVETHWHLWNTMLRGLNPSEKGSRGYFELKDRLAPLFRPVDTYRATLLSIAEGLQAGITTVHNWNHNTRSPEDADASRDAHLHGGGRARFSYSRPHERTHDGLIDMDDVRRAASTWPASVPDDRLHLGMTMRSLNAVDDPRLNEIEWAFARELGLPMTLHSGGPRENTRRYADLFAMHAGGYLGPDLQVVHAIHVTADEIRLLAETGTQISLCPLTQVRDMRGAPPISELLEAGVLVSLSIDTTASVTAADMFLQMRATYSIERQRDHDSPLSPRRLLQMATLDGARALGIDHLVGSLVPGKRADLLVVDSRAVNLAPCPNPAEQLVLAARPDNIERVYVNGDLLVSQGAFTRLDATQLLADVGESHEYLLRTAGWDAPRWKPAMTEETS